MALNDDFLEAYQRAVNKIDDYLEYRYASSNIMDMRKTVYGILEKLNEELAEIQMRYKDPPKEEDTKVEEEEYVPIKRPFPPPPLSPKPGEK